MPPEHRPEGKCAGTAQRAQVKPDPQVLFCGWAVFNGGGTPHGAAGPEGAFMAHNPHCNVWSVSSWPSRSCFEALPDLTATTSPVFCFGPSRSSFLSSVLIFRPPCASGGGGGGGCSAKVGRRLQAASKHTGRARPCLHELWTSGISLFCCLVHGLCDVAGTLSSCSTMDNLGRR